MRKLLLLFPLLLIACHRDPRPLLNGRVEAYLTDLGPRAGGRLVELNVREGQRVKAGDLLARVSAEELDAAVQRDQAGLEGAEAKRRELDRGSRAEDIAQGQARVHDAAAALKLAEASLRRARRLVADTVMSQADLDNAVSARDRAAAALNLQAKALAELKAGARLEERQAGQAAARQAGAILRQSRIQAGFLEVRAPFDGVVIHRLREPGSVLTPGQPILTLARLDELWVRIYLPQPLQAQAALGMPVTVSVPGGSAAPLNATLDEVASEAEFTPKMVESREERVNLVYAARVNLKDGWDKGLVPGVAVDVRLGGADPMILLEAEGLACRFGAKEAVKGLDLTLAEGDLVGLIGPDAAGKTTTFRMLVGLQSPTGGRLTRHLGREQIGYVPQAFSLAPDLTVGENLRLQAGLFGLPDPASRIQRLLESVGLDPFRDRLSGALSGGMKQKLALCIALLTEPRLLLLDEPTTGVDPVSRREFWALLHGVHDEGVAILFSTPYMDEAEYAHRMLLMHDGRILDQGDLASFRRGLPGLVFRLVSRRRREVQQAVAALKPLDLSAEGEILRVRFPEQDPAPLLARLSAIDGVEQARLAEASLEDVFLHAISVSGGAHG